MRTAVKWMVFAGLMTAVVLVLPVAGQAQTTKMGFIDDDKIKQNFPEWTRAQEQWEIERKA